MTAVGETVGIVVPAYRPDVEVLSAYLERLDAVIDPAVVRVELDTPRDGVRARLSGTPATVAVSTQRRGKGAAITAGFDALETDVLSFADADGSTPPAEFRGILEAITVGNADVAAGSRRHPDATVETSQSVAREVMGDAFASMARLLLDVSLYDYQCGAKAITAEGWERIRADIGEEGFAWDIEFLAFADACGLHVREVPITWHDHPDSTVQPAHAAVELATALLRTRYRARRQEPGRLPAGVTSAGEVLATLLESGSQKRNE